MCTAFIQDALLCTAFKYFCGVQCTKDPANETNITAHHWALGHKPRDECGDATACVVSIPQKTAGLGLDTEK